MTDVLECIALILLGLATAAQSYQIGKLKRQADAQSATARSFYKRIINDVYGKRGSL